MIREAIRSSTRKRFCRHTSQEVCPWEVKFSQPLQIDVFRARDIFVGTESHDEARALALELLMIEFADYVAAFRGSAIKRAKLWMLKRNACVVLGNIGTAEELPVLEAMLQHDEPLVREHAAWALSRLARYRASTQ